MVRTFDKVAREYSESLDWIPPEYVELVTSAFGLGRKDIFLELGCGTGTLALALAKTGATLIGLDSSRSMLEIAKSRDSGKRVTWELADVHRRVFPERHFTNIFSFESFHLFERSNELISRISRSLKVGGKFGIGWCGHFWEQSLREIIVDVFATHGIEWGEWGYQSCPGIEQSVGRRDLSFGATEHRRVQVLTKVKLEQIASYLTCIGKAHVLSATARERLRNDLEAAFRERFREETIEGGSEFGIKYWEKKTNLEYPNK
jgi:SAM-dependent methyltransferase